MRWLLCVCSCVLLVARASAQEPVTAGTEERTAPSVQFRGFADINWAKTSDDKADSGGNTADGFSLGYLVGHVSASLGGKFSFYSEVTLRQNVNDVIVDVARAFLRYDYNDRFKISAGRYHAPVGYWNTAFHRGAWLQTTVFRPDILKDEWFQPDHFVGVMAEGTLSAGTGLGYMAGFGNGREGDLLLSCQAGCVSHHRAQVARLFARPPQVSGIEFGGAAYHDTIFVDSYFQDFGELITSGYVAVTRETPEVIVEFSNLRHHDTKTGENFDSQAFYVQAGYRIPQQPKWKPYARFEKAISPDDEPVTGPLSNSKTTGGIRFELTDFAALKVEVAQRRNPGTNHRRGVFVQTAFTF